MTLRSAALFFAVAIAASVFAATLAFAAPLPGDGLQAGASGAAVTRGGTA